MKNDPRMKVQVAHAYPEGETILQGVVNASGSITFCSASTM